MMRPWRATEDGVELAVRLTPRAGRSGVDGIGEAEGRPVLKVRVASPPVDNAANAALVGFLAETLGVAKSAIRIVAGQKGRVKTLRIEGAGLEQRLAAVAGAQP
jgi:uncharacterized protein